VAVSEYTVDDITEKFLMVLIVVVDSMLACYAFNSVICYFYLYFIFLNIALHYTLLYCFCGE